MADEVAIREYPASRESCWSSGNATGSDPIEGGPIEVCPAEVGVPEVCPAEVGMSEVALAEVGPTEVGLEEVGILADEIATGDGPVPSVPIGECEYPASWES